MSKEFGGFAPPTSNFFRMPNEWTDITAEIDSLAELKVIEYVLRHTWGFQEYGIAKTISVDEFMHGRRRRDGSRMDKGTGLKSDRSVKDGLKLAETHGYLECEIDTSDKARVKKSYRLKMVPSADELEGVVSTPVASTPLVGSIYPSEGQNLPTRLAKSTPRSEKETQERNSGKTPKKERSVTQPSTPLLEWIKQEKVICPKDRAKVQEYIQQLVVITTKEQLHRLKEFALSQIRGNDKRVFLGNLAGSLDAFLDAERAMQAFTPSHESMPPETASQGEIEALAAEIQSAYPELVIRTGEDDYGLYIDVVYGEGENDCWPIRSAEEWEKPSQRAQKRLAQAIEYGKLHCLVA